MKRCPFCESSNITMERSLDGVTTCLDCGYRAKHHEFNPAVIVTETIFTYSEIRSQIASDWSSRLTRANIRVFLDQKESIEKELLASISKLQKKNDILGQLLDVRNERLAISEEDYSKITGEIKKPSEKDQALSFLDKHLMNKIKDMDDKTKETED